MTDHIKGLPAEGINNLRIPFGDELENLIAQEVGEGPVIDRIRERIGEIYGSKEIVLEKIVLDEFVRERLEDLKPLFSQRQVEIISSLESTPHICMPHDPLQKIIDGLIKNAIENTPDEGKIEVVVQKKGEGAELEVRDFGVGITEENQTRFFKAFFQLRKQSIIPQKDPLISMPEAKGRTCYA